LINSFDLSQCALGYSGGANFRQLTIAETIAGELREPRRPTMSYAPSSHFRFPCKLLAAGIFVALLSAQSPAVAAITWSNAGDKTFTMYPGGGTIYVAAGAKVRLEITAFVEKDTKTEDVVVNEETGETQPQSTQEADDQKQWRMKVDGQQVQTGNGPAKLDIPVGGATPAGTQFVVTFEYGDTRAATDARHDPFAAGPSYTIIVRNACPDGLAAAMTDLSGDRPNPGETYGSWRARMTANGNPPAGKNNWDGTVVTEDLGQTVLQAGKFKDGVAIVEVNGDSFVIGSAGENKFDDFHKVESIPLPNQPGSGLILKDGVNAGTATTPQDYICSPNKKYAFVITRTFNRLGGGTANERIKVTIAK
jgi:hypothetical protein